MAGFRDWHGGHCPLDLDAPVYVKFRDGSESKIRVAGDLRWSFLDLPDDIVGFEPAAERHPSDGGGRG